MSATVSRRGFLGAGAALGAVALMAPARAAVKAMEARKAPLPTVKPHDVMRAQSWNDLVERVNELMERS